MYKVGDKIIADCDTFLVKSVAHFMGDRDTDINLYVGINVIDEVDLIAENNAFNYIVGAWSEEDNTDEWETLVNTCGKGAIEYAIKETEKFDPDMGKFLWERYHRANKGQNK